MIKFEDLKENQLLTVDSLYRFSQRRAELSPSHTEQYYIDIGKYNEKISTKFLILLKRRKHSSAINSWLCFCGGKICFFNIIDFDLPVLSIIK